MALAEASQQHQLAMIKVNPTKGRGQLSATLPLSWAGTNILHLTAGQILDSCPFSAVPLWFKFSIPISLNTQLMSCQGRQVSSAFLPIHKARNGGYRRQRLHFSSLSICLPGQRHHHSVADGLLLARATCCSTVPMDTPGNRFPLWPAHALIMRVAAVQTNTGVFMQAYRERCKNLYAHRKPRKHQQPGNSLRRC